MRELISQSDRFKKSLSIVNTSILVIKMLNKTLDDSYIFFTMKDDNTIV